MSICHSERSEESTLFMYTQGEEISFAQNIFYSYTKV